MHLVCHPGFFNPILTHQTIPQRFTTFCQSRGQIRRAAADVRITTLSRRDVASSKISDERDGGHRSMTPSPCERAHAVSTGRRVVKIATSLEFRLRGPLRPNVNEWIRRWVFLSQNNSPDPNSFLARSAGCIDLCAVETGYGTYHFIGAGWWAFFLCWHLPCV